MFCNNCGTKLDDGTVFCPNCGTRVNGGENAPVETPVNEEPAVSTEANPVPADETVMLDTQAPEAPVAPESPVTNDQPTPTTPPVAPASPAASAPALESKKGGSKKLIIVGAAVAIVAILILCNLKAVGNTFRKVFLPANKYLAYVVADNTEELVSDALEIYDSYIKSAKAPNDVKGTAGLSLSFGEEAESLFKKLGPVSDYVEWINKVNAEYTINSNKAGSEGEIKFGVNGTDLISIKAATDFENIYVQIPELSKKVLSAEIPYRGTDSEEFREAMDSMSALIKACPEKAELKKISKKYIDAALKALNKAKKESKTLKAKGISQKATALKLDVDRALFLRVEKEVIQVLLKDNDLRKMLKKTYESASEAMEAYVGSRDMDFDDMYDEMLEEAEEELEYLEDAIEDAEDDKDEYGTLRVYVDGKGTIIGVTFEQGNNEIAYKHPVKGDKFGFELSYNEGRNKAEITGSGKENGKSLSGEFEVEFMGRSICKFEVKKLDKSLYKKGKGSFSIVMPKLISSDMLDSIASELEYETDIPSSAIKKVLGAELVISGTISPNSYELEVALGSGKDKIVALGVQTKVTGSSKPSIPSGKDVIEMDTNDPEDGAEEYMESISGDALIKALNKAKAPEEITDVVEEVFEKLEDGDLDNLFGRGSMALPYAYDDYSYGLDEDWDW